MRLQWLGGPWDGSYESVTPGMTTHAVPYDSTGTRCDPDDCIEIRLYSIVKTGVHDQKILWREIPSTNQRVS